MNGIDSKLYDELEAMDIEYESTRHGVSRLMRTFLKILSKHPKGIAWHQIQDEYDHIFDTLDDYIFLSKALDELLAQENITAHIGHFACMDTDVLYKYNHYRYYKFGRHTC